MNTFLQLLVNGLGKGAVYALLALGFVIIFKATEVVNFAHGSLVLVGGYLVYELKDALGWVLAAVIGIVGAALAALLIERVLLRNARSADHNSLALLTIGIDVIITEEVVRRVGADIPFIGDPYDSQPIQIGDLTVFRTQAIALVVGAVLITAFLLTFRYSNWGVAMRAQAENREAAALMGINSSRVTATAWLVAGALAGVA
ncbi:branched-chain amino acid ABC transporter permease, partial [Pseudonocardia abyssalis]